jgi:dTDP-4-amino-4,6-dideoxygalactose transaminase
MRNKVTRRGFVAAASAAGLSVAAASDSKLAILGGEPVRRKPFPVWPRFGAPEEKALQEALRSGKWYRGKSATAGPRFEKTYRELLGAKHCLATANGTAALLTSLNALEIGPGDEVLVPPYTFIATINVVLLQHALPVFVDTDIETFQVDATKIEAAITERTAAMIPVHLGGGTADMDAVLRLARKHKLPVIEDACQAHLAEWRGRRVGTFGDTGCFSFQASKNLNSGEGGAVLTDDDELAEKCYAFHNNSRGGRIPGHDFSYRGQGANLRMTEFQSSLLMAQMTRLEAQTKTREQNAAYLTGLLEEIPGIEVATTYGGCTRNAYHLYMCRYRKEAFAEAPRAAFLKAMKAEGIPCSGGYPPMNKLPFVTNVVHSKGYRAIYSGQVLKEWEERNQCPANDRLCGEAVWLTQNMLLGTRADMNQIAGAIRKIQAQAGALKLL